MKKSESVTSEPVITNPAVVSENGCFMVANSGHGTYCSMVPKTPEERKFLFNSVNSPNRLLRDYINKTISVRDVYAEQCAFLDKESGDLSEGVRIVLIDKDGNSYSTCSRGIFSGLSKLFSLYGTPDQWAEPVPILIKQISKSPRQAVLVFEIA